ncbi:flagellar motor protein MotB [Kiloniella laminariae]|uniref:flagellar motor protein MotB n=1 Tax=Kiloniella laminariae TaxID=454162 RepID=UPI0012FCBF67|nr:flagellar motor protein MotB [Kiloniella laminariae]
MFGPLLRKQHQGHDRNIVALLSLKLLLLAFFIMLNALSSFEEDKAKAVLDSVNSTFSGDASKFERHARFDQSLDNLDDKAELVSEVERLFETTIPAVEREKGSTQNFLRLRLPRESMFPQGEMDLASGRELLLKRLATTLGRFADGGGYYEFEFLYGIAGTGAAATPQDLDVAIRRSGVLAQAIESAGIPADKAAIGLQPDAGENVFFVIRVYDTAVKDITFENYAEIE